MKAVNLIPAEERPGGRRPLRSGPLAYIVVGALAAAVIAVTALVVTDHKVSERSAEVAQLQSEKTSVEAKAHALTSYIQFATAREQRETTVAGLANSRFDWERVLAELALVLPADVQITSLSGTAAPGVSSVGGSGIGLRSEIAGPALELTGCAPRPADVAGFIEALKDIDGVTRVGMPTSSFGGDASGSGESGAPCGGEETFDFQMVVGFDAAPAPLEVNGEGAPEGAAESSSSSTEESSEESSSEESSSEESSEESSPD